MLQFELLDKVFALHDDCSVELLCILPSHDHFQRIGPAPGGEFFFPIAGIAIIACEAIEILGHDGTIAFPIQKQRISQHLRPLEISQRVLSPRFHPCDTGKSEQSFRQSSVCQRRILKIVFGPLQIVMFKIVSPNTLIEEIKPIVFELYTAAYDLLHIVVGTIILTILPVKRVNIVIGNNTSHIIFSLVHKSDNTVHIVDGHVKVAQQFINRPQLLIKPCFKFRIVIGQYQPSLLQCHHSLHRFPITEVEHHPLPIVGINKFLAVVFFQQIHGCGDGRIKSFREIRIGISHKELCFSFRE